MKIESNLIKGSIKK